MQDEDAGGLGKEGAVGFEGGEGTGFRGDDLGNVFGKFPWGYESQEGGEGGFEGSRLGVEQGGDVPDDVEVEAFEGQ